MKKNYTLTERLASLKDRASNFLQGSISPEQFSNQVIWSPELPFTYCSEDRQEGVMTETETPSAIIPVHVEGPEVHCSTYHKKKGLVSGPVKFSVTTGIDSVSSYRLIHDQGLAIVSESDFQHQIKQFYREKLQMGGWYDAEKQKAYEKHIAKHEQATELPLVSSDIKVDIGKKDEEGHFVLNEGAPFSLYCLENGPENMPLIFTYKTANGHQLQCLYNAGKPALYTGMLRNPERKALMQSLLKSVKEKTYVASAWDPDQFQDTVHSNSGTRPVRRKRREQESELEKSLEETSSPTGEIDWKSPRTIKAFLDEYVIGQDDAKRAVAVCFSNYMLRASSQKEGLMEGNLLLIGPSGSGKTYMLNLLTKEAGIPFVQTKLTGKSSEGYRGQNLSQSIGQLADESGDSPYAVLFLDEIDKVQAQPGRTHDFKNDLQDELLGILEKGETVGGVKTDNLLVVTAGAFTGTSQDGRTFPQIVKERMQGVEDQPTVGFKSPPVSSKEISDVVQDITAEDIIEFGLKPELVGRLGYWACLQPLTREDKICILKESKGSQLQAAKNTFSELGYDLRIEEGVYDAIVDFSSQDTGARGLKHPIDKMLQEINFDPEAFANDEQVITVTEALAREQLARTRTIEA